MSTITVSNLPEEVVEKYRRRAEAMGVSLDTVIANQLIAGTKPSPDKRTLMETLQKTLDAHSTPGISDETIEESRRELRGE